MSDYPEHEKLLAIRDESQAIGEFLEWAEALSMSLLEYSPSVGEYVHPGSTEQLLADYFGIDLDKIETEKREMLRRMREMNEG